MADTSGTRRERRAAARAERQERERAEAARARQRKRIFQLGGAVALAAAIIVAIVIAAGGGGDGTPVKKAGESIAGQRHAISLLKGVEQRGTMLGDPSAPVTLVEFADLQCPFCRDFSVEVLPTVVENYVRTGKVRIDFRNVAFLGTDSTRGAQMAEAVGLQNRLWEFIDIFYANQGAENSGYVTDEFLREVAGAIPGVDVQRAMGDRGTASVQRLLTEATQEMQANGFTGTPSFLIGTTGGTLEPLDNKTLDVSEFTSKLDEAVQRAEGGMRR